ncbi:MAG: DUF1476 domain-containing protein [Azospirillaceae bacterium]|nr:DUF1476 domain-containing protein [Azospirillaceae bacterium]
MATFTERERAFENKFQRDAEMRFRADMRRARLLGAWAALQMALPPDQRDTYAGQLVRAHFDHHDEGWLLDRVHEDLVARGRTVSRHRIERQAGRLLAIARAEIAT